MDPEYLEQAQDDATMLAIRAQEEAGLDIITDGEMRRERTATTSRPPWRASTSTTLGPPSIAVGIPIRCRGSPDRSCGRTPSASATWSS